MAVDSTMTIDRSMSSGPDTMAMDPVLSTRMGNAKPRPMKVLVSAVSLN